MTAPDPQHAAGPEDESVTEPTRPAGAGSGIPVTGEPDVDRALESLQDLDSTPLAEHHERLSRVHEELHRALNPQQGPA
jgi:hypothetical protein